MLAIALVRAALAAGWNAGRGFDADTSKDWDDAWRHVLYVDLPDGRQVSWHMSPSEVPLLEGIPNYQGTWNRSEEHTSELQSLMRISYAVFCLKKNKKNT